MSDLLHELENNEAILLMYIAGELPDEDRREVEQMLETDVRLREMHEALRASWDSAWAGLERVDMAEPLAASSREAAARAVGRMVRQRHAVRMASRPLMRAAAGTSLRAWLVWSSSAAAALLVGFLVWWGIFADPLSIDPSRSGRMLYERPQLTQTDRGWAEYRGLDQYAISPVDALGLSDHTLLDAQAAMDHLEDLGRGLSGVSEN